MILVGQASPSFNAMAVMPDGKIEREFNFESATKDQMNVLFFFSMAFSYVCPTELLSLNEMMSEFKQRKTLVHAIGCDSHLSIQRWVMQSVDQGGLGGPIGFPIISDPSRKITEAFGVLVNNTLPLRATFLIDKYAVVRSASINDFHMGRNIDEVLRLIDAHQIHEATGELAPANWTKDQPTLTSDPSALGKYLSQRYQAHRKSA